MNRSLRLTKTAAAVMLASAAWSANAVLERVGPTDPANGFPRWYQDTTGIALELCLPQSQAELADGHCLLTAAELAAVPETFPGNFFDEHFWWAGEALMTLGNGSRALLVLALEAAFAVEQVKQGDQIAFSRIRLRVDDVPVSGTYRFIHPYGEESIEGEAGERIFFTEDIGVACAPGDFSCAMSGRSGPFLLPSAQPGGAEQPPVTGPVPGKLYIADPNREGPVTGSPLPDFLSSDGLMHNHNVFRIEGPPGSNLDGAGNDFIETHNFSLMGRLYGGQMPSKVQIERASYRHASGERAVDVYAKALPTAGTRIPGQERPAAVPPVMSFYTVPCATRTDAAGHITGYAAPASGQEILMAAAGDNRWGQYRPADAAAFPDSVCVKDNSATDAQGRSIPAYHQVPVNDAVSGAAYYDPVNWTLTVEARSSDAVGMPVLRLPDYSVELSGGTATVANVAAPPSRVRVSSSARGSESIAVETGIGAEQAANNDQLAADNDAASTAEEVAVVIPVIDGDTLNGQQIDPAATPITISIIQNGVKGTAVANNATGSITYTPHANASGSDSFTYVVGASNATSNIATVTVSIGPVNDPPQAAADSATGVVNTPLAINVLGNDSDPDGDALAIVAGSVSPPVGPAGSTSSATANADGSIGFSGSAAGSYSFSYRVTDGSVVSAPVPVTVVLSAPETVNATTAEYRSDKGRWRISGTTSIAAAHALTITLTGVAAGGVPCDANGTLLGTVTSAAGAFSLDLRNGPAPGNCNAVRVDSELGGVDPSTTLRIRR